MTDLVFDEQTMSSSEEVAFKTCRLAHHFAYDLRYAPAVTNRKLSVGIGTHRGIETHYKGGTLAEVMETIDKWAEERWREIVAAGLADTPIVRIEFINDRDLVKEMVRGYIEWVTEEGLDDDYEVVSVEEAIHLSIPGAPCVLPVKLDLLQRNKRTGLLRIVDYKTRAQFYYDTTGYQLAEANGNYSLAVFAQYGERPTELAYRELRKIVPSERSKPPYFREVLVRLTPEAMVKRVEDYIATAIERFDPDRAIYPNPSSCCGSWKADWRGPCLKVAEGMSPIEALETSTDYRPQDPYARYGEDDDT